MRYYSRVGPRASACEKVFFSTFSLSGFFELKRNWIWLIASVKRWAVIWVTDYFFIQFYVSAIFHNDWTPEMKRWKERLCIISTVFNWHSTSVSSTEFNTELITICTVRDSTRWIEWKVKHEVFNSTRRGEWKLKTDGIKWKVLLLHCTPLHFRRVLHFYTYFTLLHFPLLHSPLYTFHFSGNEKGRNDPSIRVLLP